MIFFQFYLHEKLGNETRKILFNFYCDSTFGKRWTDKHARTECSASCSITYMYVRTGKMVYVSGVIVCSNVYYFIFEHQCSKFVQSFYFS